MSYFIPFLQEENLIGSAGLEINFQDKHLVRYLTFAKHLLRRAINICQKDIAAGIFCLLTESDTHFAIWREQSSQGQKVRVEATAKLQPQLNTSQLPHPTKKESKPKTANIDSTPRSVFLALLNQELTQHIGPMADYLINKLLAERPTIDPQQMIQAIVAEIPDPKESQNIQRALERFTDRFTEMIQDHLIFRLNT